MVSIQAAAVEITVQDPCSESQWLAAEVPYGTPQTVGELTIAAFNSFGMDYVGTTAGINSIRNTVTGDLALEILSDHSMRAYGWCYRHNGQVPDVLADQLYIKSDSDKILWFFAYATYENGVWKDYCTPTHTSRPAFICPG